MLVIFTVLHFLVDGICGAALAVYALNQPFFEPIIYYFGMYNAVAFGTQWLTGYLFDRKENWLRGSFIFAALTLGAGTVPALGIAAQTLLLGIGNSVFHVAAGSIVLRRFPTYKELGIFVSGGAVGLALGLNSFVGPYPFLLACTVLSLFVSWQLNKKDTQYVNNKYKKTDDSISVTGADSERQACFAGNAGTESAAGFSTVSGSLTGAAAISMFFLLGCIVLRSMGSGQGDSSYIMLFPCVFAAGKALGGIVCDRIGYKQTIITVFLLSFIALQLQGLAASVLLVLAFNMTMPLTLRLVHWCNPRYPGMMFGLAAGCLLPGVYYHGFSIPPQAMVVLQFLCLAAAGRLLLKEKADTGVSGSD